MARMATGVPLSDYSAISGVNYDTLASFRQAGLERVYQAEKAKNDRIRKNLKEAEDNRLLNQKNTGTIAGLLNNNPELLKEINSGQAPSAVTKAYKSYEKGGGNLNSTALLANYLETSNEEMKAEQALQFAQEQDRILRETARLNALARVLSEENEASKPKPLLLAPDKVSEFQTNNPNLNFPLTPKQVGDKTFFEVGTQKTTSGDSGEFVPLDQYEKLVADTGTQFKRTPVYKDGVLTGYNVQESYAPTEELTYDQIFMEKSAEEDAKNLSARKEAIRTWFTDKRPNIQRNIQVYDRLINDLKTNKIELGGLVEYVPDIGTLRDSARAFFNTTGQDAVDSVRIVVFQSLKAILGGAFSAQEANRLSASAYNPQLQGTEGREKNIQRLQDANNVLKAMYEAKMLEFEAYQRGEQYFGPSPLQILKDANDRLAATYPVGATTGTTTSGNTYGGVSSSLQEIKATPVESPRR